MLRKSREEEVREGDSLRRIARRLVNQKEEEKDEKDTCPECENALGECTCDKEGKDLEEEIPDEKEEEEGKDLEEGVEEVAEEVEEEVEEGAEKEIKKDFGEKGGLTQRIEQELIQEKTKDLEAEVASDVEKAVDTIADAVEDIAGAIGKTPEEAVETLKTIINDPDCEKELVKEVTSRLRIAKLKKARRGKK